MFIPYLTSEVRYLHKNLIIMLFPLIRKKDEFPMLVHNICYFVPTLADECYSGIPEKSILDHYGIFIIDNIAVIEASKYQNHGYKIL